MITANEMILIVKAQLATDLNCDPADLDGKKDGFAFFESRENEGRRPFPRNNSHFEMLSMGKSIVVSATTDILPIAKAELTGQDRDRAFSLPFIYGQALYYLPDLGSIKALSKPAGFSFELVEHSQIQSLYDVSGFTNALSYDPNHARPDVLATVARQNGHIVGIAGASRDCAKMWQVGMDVLPPYRGHGVAAYLVNWLTLEILNREYVPYYGTASSNIASQRVAHRTGYQPAWICTYQTRFGDFNILPAC